MQALARQSFTNQALRRTFARPAALVPARSVSTQPMSKEEALEYLNQQRAKRASSPWHIYQPQLTSMSSIANRVTGTGLSVAFYGIFLSHVIAPVFGASVDSAALIDAWTALPSFLQLTTKTAVVGATAYHTFNGLRHLSWDMGYLLDLKTSYMAGYAVIGASALSTAAILAM
ncbi:succinate dehydrogenase (ubiquinone) cytochromeb subunit [Rhodotorula toruloides]|uniref:Succinate dehydrogenase (Ubiquinone) cytochromeb subunit n=1 Tax=Rhodotorula toruloides TaxID=5286 RepID=A0A511KAT4_RHOTO|nr:succinate dehydrogenase (ubiquinone) cytochromeb subunit [Rhodotorula toruloides]